MRLCYFIQNHLAPAQARRLVGTLRRLQPDASILASHDPFAGHCSTDELRRGLDADVFEVREPARRGYLSVLEPYFDAVEWLARHGVSYDWLVYLSAQDYPTRPLGSFESRLATGGYDGYLSYSAAGAASALFHRRYQAFRRYYYQYFEASRWTTPALRAARVCNRVQPWVHLHLVYGPRVGVRPARPPFGGDLTCYVGRQWTVLRRACAEHVLERVRGDNALVKWFRRTICPCEAMVQTLLVNCGEFNLCNDDLRFADFTGSRDGSPRTLTSGDLDRLARGSHFFARKFGLDADVLDRLDARLGAA